MSVEFLAPMVRDLQRKGYEVVSVSSAGPELDGLRQMDVKVLEVEMERRMSLLKDIKSLFQLIRVFRMERPDMVHSMTPKAGLLCMMAAWITRVPRRVHTFTGLVFPTSTGIKRRILMFTDWLTCACATHIIPEGEGVKRDLLDNGITGKPLKVLGYGNVRGVDLARWDNRRDDIQVHTKEICSRLRLQEKFVFLFVGRLVGDKGINELVEAFSQLNKAYPDTRLMLVGRYEDELDPIKDESKDIIKNSPAILELGPKYEDELVAYYAAADCFVFPSYREGFPNTVLEAGAMGLPSIVTDINGSREIVTSGENGIVIPSKSVPALLSSMRQMIENKAEAVVMGERARTIVASRYEQGFVRKCLYDFYDEILKQ
jgi:glycosyltransferase involved in cell wall biosynthesis